MRNLLLLAFKCHWRAHRSTSINFWSGIIGMIINNVLLLLGIWAMLFAGKDHLNSQKIYFFTINFVLMFAWGIFHILFGGLALLANLIHTGGLDRHMLSGRPIWLSVATLRSDLACWGDIVIATCGFAVLFYYHGWLFAFGTILMLAMATLALMFTYVAIGTLGFWISRSGELNNVLINAFLAINSYPVLDPKSNHKVFMFLIPALAAGMIPGEFLNTLLTPLAYPLVLKWIAYEGLGTAVIGAIAFALFHWGLKHYQSSPFYTGAQ